MSQGKGWSLRSKLVLASLTVEILMLGLLLAISLRVAEERLLAQTRQRIEEIGVLFEAALAPPLVARDYAALTDILTASQRRDGLAYLVLTDDQGRALAQVGWPPDATLPTPMRVVDAAAARTGRLDLSLPIRMGGHEYGRLAYGLSTQPLLDAQAQLLEYGLIIAGAALLLSIGLLGALSTWLTRHLTTLTTAASAVGEGRYEPLTCIRSGDEVGRLALAFNHMAEAIAARVRALTETEARLREALITQEHAQAEQRRYAQAAEAEHARLLALLSAMKLGVLYVGVDGRVLYHNPAFRRIWMLDETADVIGLPVSEALPRTECLLARPDHFSRHVLAVLDTHEVSDSVELELADGRVITQVSYPVWDRENRYIGQLWIYEDVTHERQTAAQLAYLAERDSLTGLYNRHYFEHELDRQLADCERSASMGALLFFDLDEFKAVNDHFGHRAGDALLIRLAGELNTMVRRNEVLARLGGDEFALLVAHTTREQTEQLAERIVRAISAIPYRFDGHPLRLTCSVGVAFYPEHGADAESLIAHADAAMYQAKQAGKNAWRIYDAQADASPSLVTHLTWNERIDRALRDGLFTLHFQGVYRLADNRLSHMEALVRMRDAEVPDHLILPGRFIPVAEKSGRIVEIDRWVLRECVRLLARRPRLPALAVNISARSLGNATLPAFILQTLKAHEVEPQRLIIELTETSAVTDLTDAQRLIEVLYDAGVAVALDDFGIGFSSFAYLKHLPVHWIKIDGMFIRNLYQDRDNQTIVRAIAEVARGMGKRTIAEFVEDEITLQMLRDMGIDCVQGYILDRPRADHPAIV